MANNKKSSKPTLTDRINAFKKNFAKLDKKSQTQIIGIAAGIVVVAVVAVAAVAMGGKEETQPGIIAPTPDPSIEYDKEADKKYKDKYLEEILKYEDIIIPESETEDKNYIKETLFVGDSNTEGLYVYGHLSMQNAMGVTGMPINTVTSAKCMWFAGRGEPVTIPTAISMVKPRRIIINYGTNNAGGTETDSFIKMYKNALQVINKTYPYADIIVSSILPVGEKRDYPYITMQQIDEFNLALAEMCQDEGYMFLDTASILKNPDTGFIQDKYISKDGIHLSKEGFQKFLEIVNGHQHIVEDTRPDKTKGPTRVAPPEPTATPSPTPEPTATPTASPTPSPSPSTSPSASPSPTVTPTATTGATATPKPTATTSVEATATVAPTTEATKEPENTEVVSPTEVPVTPVPATATPAPTEVPVTPVPATPTPVPATPEPTPTPEPAPTEAPTDPAAVSEGA